MADPTSSVRDRAFTALLLLVGASAVASGLFEIFALSNTSPAAIFDSVLGGTIVLVTWLFVIPTVRPKWYGDLSTAESPISRPYLIHPILAPSPPAHGTYARPPRNSNAAAPATATKKEPEIPRWADPLVAHSPVHADNRPAAIAEPRPRPVETIPTAARNPPVRVDSLAEAVPVARLARENYGNSEFLSARSQAPFSGKSTSEAERETWPPPQGASDVLRELDLITAELRNPPRRPPPRGVDNSGATEGNSVGDVASDDEPLSGFG